jgi:hypothetical protein
MILEGYFDDSADDQRRKYYACGGAIGTPAQWDLFEALWSMETAHLKEPFRSTDCECGHGQFSDWPRPKRDDMMQRLVETIYKADLHGYAAVVPISDFKEVFSLLDVKEAFTLAASQVILNMAYVADSGMVDASLWFEDGPTNGAVLSANAAVHTLDWKPNRRLRGLTFADKKLRSLQAVDFVARESFKHIDNLGIRQPRKSFIPFPNT